MKKEEHKYTFKMIKLDDILKTGDLNIRKVNGYDDLLASIKAHGIINPVTVVPIADGYKLIAGFRRCWAAAQLGMEKVPLPRLRYRRKEHRRNPLSPRIFPGWT